MSTDDIMCVYVYNLFLSFFTFLLLKMRDSNVKSIELWIWFSFFLRLMMMTYHVCVCVFGPCDDVSVQP